MKKKLLACGMALSLLAMSLTGCGGAPKTEPVEPEDTAAVSSAEPQPEESSVSPEASETSVESSEEEASEIVIDTDEPEKLSGEDTVEEQTVLVQWANEVPGSEGIDELRVSESEYSAHVLFTAKQTVKNFKVLALEFQDIDDEGNVSFAVEELYTVELTPERPLMVQMELVGTIPNNGISYEEEDGTVRQFSVNESGKDGSLFLMEF